MREGENTYFRVLDENITSTEELRSRLADKQYGQEKGAEKRSV